MSEANFDAVAQQAIIQSEADPAKWSNRAVNGLRAGVIAAEVSLANEAMRFAAFGAAQAAYGDARITALAFGGSTVAIEGAAGFATAGALATDTAKNAMDKASNLLEKVGVKKDAKTSPVTKGAAALVGGTAISMILKHREEPERTVEENRRYGVKSAVGLGAFCTAQGYFMAKGIEVPEPEYIGAGIFALVGAKFAGSSLIKYMQNRKEADND